MARTTNGSVRWRVSKLKAHPKQAIWFADVSDDELEALVQDMREHGQREPIQILPSGVLLAGHQRARAARRLRWRFLDAVIRDDLAEAGEKAQEAFLISSNLTRRHLTALGKARCLRRLLALEAEGRTNTSDWKNKEILKARIGKRLNISLRSVNRYLLALEAPAAVQAAFDRNEATLIAVGKVALLPRSTQREIVRRIEEGEPAKTVIVEHVGKSNSRHRKLGDAVESFTRALERAIADLDGRLEKVGPAHVSEHLSTLMQARTVIKTLIHKAKQKSPTVAEAFANCFAADAE
jgi:ParB-like chromosome segregation protein Spo0J